MKTLEIILVISQLAVMVTYLIVAKQCSNLKKQTDQNLKDIYRLNYEWCREVEETRVWNGFTEDHLKKFNELRKDTYNYFGKEYQPLRKIIKIGLDN